MIAHTITTPKKKKNASLVLLKMAAEEEWQSLESTTTISSSDNDQPEKQPISRPPSLGLRHGCSFNKDLIVKTTVNNSTYTSLRDLIHTNGQTPRIQIQSPTFCCQQDDLPIRNRLVKQAACAYLLPKASPSSNKDRPDWFRNRRDDEELLDSSCSDGCLGFVYYMLATVLTAIRKLWGRDGGDFASD